MSLRVGRFAICVVVSALLVTPPRAQADEPLHERIDRLIERAAKAADEPLAGRTTDAEFLRRVYLDFAGRIPSADETRRFLKDGSSGKRQKLIDRLLGKPEYPRRMRELFHVMLMERRGDNGKWTGYLQSSFAANKPWDRMTREMLAPNAEDEATRGAAFFQVKRLEKYGQNPTDYAGLTRDVGRIFLGMDVQCAQCHDHLFVDDYKQEHFQGMFAFFTNTFIRTDKKFPAIGEKPLKAKLTFASVFTGDEKNIGPRLPGGMEIEIPAFKKGEEFVQPPDRKTRFPGTPKFSPLAILADQLPTAGNRAFPRNIANRLWFVMVGRGLVHPLDLHHSGNPASHPELLDLLAAEIAAHGFDVKWMLRELALTQTYQRSSRLPAGVENPAPEKFTVAIERGLSAEQLLWSMLQATGEIGRYPKSPPANSDEPAVALKPGEKPAAQQPAPDSADLNELMKTFVTAFGNAPKEPELQFSPTLKAALFVSNSATILAWLERRNGNLIDKLASLDNSSQVAEELYLSLLTRLPTYEETAEVVAYLQKHESTREKALGQLAWALLASTEFCTNH